MLSGILAYALAVVLGGSTGLELEEIFIKSIFAFIIIFAGSFLLLYFLEKVPLNETKETETETDDVKFTEEDEIETVEAVEKEEEDIEEDSFFPLEIPVVEVEEAQ